MTPARGPLASGRHPLLTEHKRCGDLDADVEGPVVWFACECGARMARRVDEGDGAPSLI